MLTYYGKSYGEMSESYLRRMYPDDWAAIAAERAAAAKAKAASVYFDPYQQATGEFLEYACGRALT